MRRTKRKTGSSRALIPCNDTEKRCREAIESNRGKRRTLIELMNGPRQCASVYIYYLTTTKKGKETITNSNYFLLAVITN